MDRGRPAPRNSFVEGTRLLMRGALRVLGIIVLLALVLGVVQIARPVPKPTLSLAPSASPTIAGTPPHISWPTSGEAAVAAQGVGWFGTSGGNTPIPIGSVAKMMTALVVLTKYPLSPGQSGPSVQITARDVQQWRTEASQQQSTVAVAAGEKLTELQLLQGLLIPSGNNLAQVLARWVAGSQSAFVAEMNAQARRLGLRSAHYADASGLSPQTVSDAADQLRLAEKLMQNPVFAAIVASPQVTLPVAGLLYNYDYAVGHNGIVGIKTGSTLAAGGCFVFARSGSVNGRPVTIVGAVLGQGQGTVQPLQTALDEGVSLSAQALSAVRAVRIEHAGQTVAWLQAPWHAPVAVTADAPVEFLGWPGLHVSLRVRPRSLGTHVPSGAAVGTATWSLGQQSARATLHAAGGIPAPGLRWKLSRL